MSSDRNNAREAARPTHSWWCRILSALWLAWLLALMYMSRAEWCRARPVPGHGADVAPPGLREPQTQE